jgi:hypothetical protein
MLKETALRVGFSDAFRSGAAFERMDRATLQQRLLLVPVRPGNKHRPQADERR